MVAKTNRFYELGLLVILGDIIVKVKTVDN